MPQETINNNNRATMVEIFVNLLSFILLGITATALGTLYFQIINKYFLDPLAGTVAGYGIGQVNSSAVRYAIAALVVGFPLYVWALYFWFKRISVLPDKVESRLSKWLTYIILLAAAGTIIGDLIGVIFNFLQGEFTMRFFLKAITILVIAGLVFGFYYLERKKIQYKKDVKKSWFLMLFIVTAVIVVAGIIVGFFVAGSPAKARLLKFDMDKVNNLQQISNAVNQYAGSQGKLPDNLFVLKQNPTYTYYFSGVTDEQLKNDYQYRVIVKDQYELCSNFNLPAPGQQDISYYYPMGGSWDNHEAGRVCKTLNATLYNKQK